MDEIRITTQSIGSDFNDLRCSLWALLMSEDISTDSKILIEKYLEEEL